MKVKHYRSSTVGVSSNGVKILMDPWLTDGEYYGSWYHFPYFDIEKYKKELNSYDCIFISHIHPDHCSEKTLKYINKDIPIYIHSFHEKFLKFKLERLGFKVIELENNKRTCIKNNVHINIIAADNCDPELCYKFFGCKSLDKTNGSKQIDTISVIDDNNFSIVNVNDCPFELSFKSLNILKQQYDRFDLLLTGYTGAGPYPQCIKNYSLSEKNYFAHKKKIFFLNQAFKYIEKINPRFYLPFAGTYCLAGKLSQLNKFRGISSIEDAYNYIDNLISEKETCETKPLKLNYEQIFDLSLNESSNEYKPLNLIEEKKYINKKLSFITLDYEKENLVSDEELISLSEKAFKRYKYKKLNNNFKSDTSIYVKLTNRFIKINNITDNIEFPKLEKLNKKEKYIHINTDLNLLKNLLSGPKYAHWNNAEVGSHLLYFRNPNIFERSVYENMSYFHD